MENLKIMAENLSQKKEIIDLFIEFGYSKDSNCTYCDDSLMAVHVYKDGDIQDVLDSDYDLGSHREITLDELSDMVVLKRNDVNDATHLDSNFYKWYVASDEKHYRYQGEIWVHQPYISCLELKPIEKEMKQEESKTGIEATLSERQSTYGSFEDVSFVTESIVSILKKCNYEDMPHTHRMSMYMIASKMARLVCGDHNHLDSWHDIGGYAKLVEDLI